MHIKKIPTEGIKSYFRRLPSRLKKIPHTDLNKDHAVALATVAMAITSILMFNVTKGTREIQEQGLSISKQLSDLQEKANNQNLVRLQSELRPYLIPKLMQNPPDSIIDGQQGIMIFTLIKEKHLNIKFTLENVGSMPALNVRAYYDSPSQTNEQINLILNAISPKSGRTGYWTPAVNISTILEKENFEVILRLEYDGYKEIDDCRYSSLLKLKIKKKNSGKYELVNQELLLEKI